MWLIVGKTLFIVLFWSLNLLAKKYTPAELLLRGVITKNNMPFCEALNEYVIPYDYKDNVSECAYATRLMVICQGNPHARWQFGRCFCPESNSYYDRHPSKGVFIRRTKMSDFENEDVDKRFAELQKQINTCKPFKPRDNPFARSVYLKAQPNFFIVHKNDENSKWSNFDDVPAPQGNVTNAVRMMSLLNLPLGFGFIDEQPIMPTFQYLVNNLSKLKIGIDFFEVEQELTGQNYLVEYALGNLPISRIEKSGDATFYHHDMSLHVPGLILLPKKIRELSKRQTHYLLNFIDFFSKKFSESGRFPYNLMLAKMIEHHVQTIDEATGNLTQHLAELAKLAGSFEKYREILMNLDQEPRKLIHDAVMAVTYPPGPQETKNVADFLIGFENLLMELFREEPIALSFISTNLRTYIDTKNKYEKNFRFELSEKDRSNETFGADLYIDWIMELHEKGTAIKANLDESKK